MRKKDIINRGAVLILIIIGAIFLFGLVGYTVLGCAFELAAGIVLLYSAVDKVRARKPKTAKILKRVLTWGLIAAAAFLVGTEVYIISGSASDAEPNGRYVIVLGAGVNGTEPSWSLKTRLEAALSYLEDNSDAVCIVSGGQGPGEQITEAQCMENWLEEKGIDPERIIKEEQAGNTSENIKYSLRLIGDDDRDGIVIVTSEYHLARAKLIAGRECVRAQGIAAKTGLPVLTVNYFLREALSLWKYLIFG